MYERQNVRLTTATDAAWARGRTTLEEIMTLASGSPVDTREAINIARAAGIEVDGNGDEAGSEDLSTLAGEGPTAFTIPRKRVPAKEELTVASRRR